MELGYWRKGRAKKNLGELVKQVLYAHKAHCCFKKISDIPYELVPRSKPEYFEHRQIVMLEIVRCVASFPVHAYSFLSSSSVSISQE
jgi:hypothetical protein